MKSTMLLVLIMIAKLSLPAQNTIKVNTLNPDSRLFSSGYMNPDFINGTIHFRNGVLGQAKLNFNRFTNQVLFIAPAADTLALAEPETVLWVEIGIDTMYFYHGLVLQKVTHNKTAPDLFVRQNLKMIGKEKKSGYGFYSGAGAINSVPSVSRSGELTTQILADENILYRVETYFYLSDPANNLYPAKKNQLAKACPQHENEINSFIKTQQIDVDKKEDLLQVIDYIQRLML